MMRLKELRNTQNPYVSPSLTACLHKSDPRFRCHCGAILRREISLPTLRRNADDKRLRVLYFLWHWLTINYQAFNVSLDGFLGFGDSFLKGLTLRVTSRKRRHRNRVTAFLRFRAQNNRVFQ